MKNYFGRESHPSDHLVHWTEDIHTKKFKKKNDQLRADWDLLVEGPTKEAFFRLMDAQREVTHADEADFYAGESL